MKTVEPAQNRTTEELHEAVERLNDENQRYVIGVLEALSFAQNAQVERQED